MPKSACTSIVVAALFASLHACAPTEGRSGADAPPDITPNAVIPTPAQVAYQRMEFIGFVHLSLNTWTDREWGYGDESPALFDPTDLDADQWARVAAEVGMGELILTAKHHDGFALWPSAYTDHSVAASPWRDGEGDVVADFVAAARAHGLEVGLYLSPWDRNRPEYGQPAYLAYYRAQLRELLTSYGDVNELWVDGANGGDGYYGGAREERRIDRERYYDWPGTLGLATSLQPDLLVFSDAGPDLRWMGNEAARAGETNWSTIDNALSVPGRADPDYLNRGDEAGSDWVVPVCNTSIRPGWFYHTDEDDEVKTPSELVDIWYRSVGRNCVLLLNVPPDRRGRFHEHDVAALREFRRIVDATFDDNLARRARVSADGHRLGHARFAPANLVDDDPETYWATDDEARSATLLVEFDGDRTLDRIVLQEPIRFGQRIRAVSVEARSADGWTEVARATTVGYKRILRMHPVTADGVRITILDANNVPALSEVGVYLSDPAERPGAPRR